MMLGLFKSKPNSGVRTAYWRSFLPEGIAFGHKESDLPHGGVDARALDTPAVDGFLTQMDDDGRLTTLADTKLLPWADLFDLLASAEQNNYRDLLCLPEVASHVPSLLSVGSLRDPTFRILVEDWRRPDLGRPLRAESSGAIILDDGDIRLLPRKTWELLDQVSHFEDRPHDERGEADNRRQWGRIRRTRALRQRPSVARIRRRSARSLPRAR
jgi:hypothetical protein